jgi:hypothetical protein
MLEMKSAHVMNDLTHNYEERLYTIDTNGSNDLLIMPFAFFGDVFITVLKGTILA